MCIPVSGDSFRWTASVEELSDSNNFGLQKKPIKITNFIGVQKLGHNHFKRGGPLLGGGGGISRYAVSWFVSELSGR